MNGIKSYCCIVPGRVLLNGEAYFESAAGRDFLPAFYERLKIAYRKFYKMDVLSKLGFLASELLLGVGGGSRELHREDVGMVFFNRSASLDADRNYRQTISDKAHFFPSPSDFVYTLPNIVMGEIAIRNKIYGETAFYVAPAFQADRLCEAVDDLIRFAGMRSVLAGWLEVDPFSGTFACLMILCEAEGAGAEKRIPLNAEMLEDLWKRTVCRCN